MKRSTGEQPRLRAPDSTLDVLLNLLACDGAGPGVRFVFDVSNETYVADLPPHPFRILVISGPMSLAIYNDLKLSQFILESDVLSRPDCRWFTLTECGRAVDLSHGEDTWGD